MLSLRFSKLYKEEQRLKIIENYDLEGVQAETIPAGDLFVSNGSYCMRIKEDSDLNNLISQGVDLHSSLIAVDMATGEIILIERTKLVPPIYARIRINGRAD